MKRYLHVLSYGRDLTQKLPLMKIKIEDDVVYAVIGMTHEQYVKLDIRDEKNNQIRPFVKQKELNKKLKEAQVC
jgi:hypothetical protein